MDECDTEITKIVVNENSVKFILTLQRELKMRQERNPQYSLRAFAHFLRMDPSYLSKILRGLRKVSLKTQEEILLKLTTEANHSA